MTGARGPVVAIDARGYFLRGGIGGYTRNLVRELVATRAAGVELRLLIAPGRHADDLHLPAADGALCRSAVEIRVSQAGWMNADEEDRWLDEEIAGADLFHSMTGHWLPRHDAVRTVATLHDLTPLLRPRLASAEARRAAARIVRHIECASHLVVVSHSTAADARTLLAGRVPPMSIIPGAAASIFRPGVQAGDTLHRYGLDRDGFFLAAGVSQPQGTLERLAAAHGQSGVTRPMIVAGAHDETASTMQRLEPRVRLVGEVTDDALAALYASCRAFVYPSPGEGFALPVIEALACGAAVVSVRSSSIPEITGDAALLADPARTRSLVAALKRIDADAALREQCRRLAIVRAAAFSWARTAAATQRVYHTVLEARAA